VVCSVKPAVLQMQAWWWWHTIFFVDEVAGTTKHQIGRIRSQQLYLSLCLEVWKSDVY